MRSLFTFFFSFFLSLRIPNRCPSLILFHVLNRWLNIHSFGRREFVPESIFSVLFSNMYPKIKFTAKGWSDLRKFYRKVIFVIFSEFLSKKIFLNFFAEFDLLAADFSKRFCENFRINVENLAPSYLLFAVILIEKMKIFDFFFFFFLTNG